MKSRSRTLRAVAATLLWCAVALAGSGATVLAATPDQAPPIPAGQARVWFLRQLLPGTAFHPPMVYVNGSPIAVAGEGTVFYRDFAPGKYVFSVENCLPERGTSQTMTLTPDMQVALLVNSDENGAWDCTPPQISYLQWVQPGQVPYLFAPLTYMGPM
jgi:hypothetical protein